MDAHGAGGELDEDEAERQHELEEQERKLEEI